mgnify:CR=1 FL=1
MGDAHGVVHAFPQHSSAWKPPAGRQQRIARVGPSSAQPLPSFPAEHSTSARGSHRVARERRQEVNLLENVVLVVVKLRQDVKRDLPRQRLVIRHACTPHKASMSLRHLCDLRPPSVEEGAFDRVGQGLGVGSMADGMARGASERQSETANPSNLMHKTYIRLCGNACYPMKHSGPHRSTTVAPQSRSGAQAIQYSFEAV